MTTNRTARMEKGRARRSLVTRLVWLIAALALLAIGYLTWMGYENGELGTSIVVVLRSLALPAALVVFVLCGALIVSRRPQNIIGWLLIVPGLAIPLSDLGAGWLVALDPAPEAVDPWLWMVLWFSAWSWVLLIFPVFHLLLTFPTGRLLSPRWRWAAGLEGLMVATMMFLAAFSKSIGLETDDGSDIWTVPNPVGFISNTFFDGVFGSVWSLALLSLTVTSLVAVFRRFRTGSSEVRQQMKWLLGAVALFAVVYGASVASVSGPGDVLDLLFAPALAAIPVAVAIAVLRYRLYDIDRIFSRTVSYSLVVGILAAIYVGGVTWLTSLLPDQSQLVVAGTTLAVATLFNPLRRRIQGWVDRRFNRSRYDTQRVMDGFAGSLQNQMDTDHVVHGWVSVVSKTMQPASVSVWVREENST